MGTQPCKLRINAFYAGIMISTLGITLLCLAALLHSSVSGAIVKRSADDSQQQCSYSFNVLANTGETCPSTSPRSDNNLTELATIMAKQHADLEDKLSAILSRLGPDDSSSSETSSGDGTGVNYKRWGRTTCPDTATLVYEGDDHYISQS